MRVAAPGLVLRIFGFNLIQFWYEGTLQSQAKIGPAIILLVVVYRNYAEVVMGTDASIAILNGELQKTGYARKIWRGTKDHTIKRKFQLFYKMQTGRSFSLEK